MSENNYYKLYQEISQDWYFKCLLFADSRYEGNIQQQMKTIDQSISEILNHYKDPDHILIGQLQMRKGDSIRYICQGQYFDIQKASINEALRIFTLKKDESLKHKLLYYQIWVVIASIERVSRTVLVVNDAY